MNIKKDYFEKFNILPKVLCIFVAFIIWLYVTAVESPDYEETIYQVPVDLIGVSTIEKEYNLSVFSGYDATVDISIKGQQSTINRYTVEDFNVTADVSDLSDGGRYELDLSFDMPSGVTLSKSSDKTVDVYIDEKTSTAIDVKPRVTYVSNYEVGDFELDNDVVIISGPKKLVNEVDYAVVRVDAGTVDAKTTVSGPLTIVNKSGEDMSNPYLKLSKSEAKVTIPIYDVKEVKVNVPLKYGYYNKNTATIKVVPETIVLRGDPNVLQTITSVNTTVVDEKKITGDSTLKLAIQIPDNVSLSSAASDSVEVSITHTGTTVKTLNVKNFNVIGDDDLSYRILNSYVTVKLRGTAEELKEITADDITINVDLSGYDSNSTTISMPVSITIDSDSEDIYEIGDYIIQVEIN